MNLNTIDDFLTFQLNNSIYVWILMVLFIEKIKRVSSKNILTTWIFNFIGTFFHEITHYFVALILNGKPSKFNIFPKKVVFNNKNYYSLGNIEVGNLRWYNRFFIGMSPFLLLIIVYYLDKYFFYFFENRFLENILFIYLIVVFLSSSIPSIVDFKNAFSKNGYLIGFVTILIIPFYFGLYKF
jgi:hypothetical protein